MTAQEFLRQGARCEAAGDLDGAEDAYRGADQLGDAEGAILLGLILRRRGDTDNAVEAIQRAESRGHPEAGSSLGNLLSEIGNFDGARAAYERSIAAGSRDAQLNLGLMLADQDDFDQALVYLRAADEAGEPVASWAIGRILESREDLEGAAAAYRRGADGGVAPASFGLGAVLAKLKDFDGARTAFVRARELGYEHADNALEYLEIEASAHAQSEMGVRWAKLYIAACGDVHEAAKACLEVANEAVGARSMAEQRPQHEISIQHFTKMAEAKEREFSALYGKSFEEASAAARDAAAQLVASQGDFDQAEMMVTLAATESEMEMVTGATAVLSAGFGPTPETFLQAIAEQNRLVQLDDVRVVYAPSASEERTCPWCTATIEAAAAVCRSCGREAQAPPNLT